MKKLVKFPDYIKYSFDPELIHTPNRLLIDSIILDQWKDYLAALAYVEQHLLPVDFVTKDARFFLNQINAIHKIVAKHICLLLGDGSQSGKYTDAQTIIGRVSKIRGESYESVMNFSQKNYDRLRQENSTEIAENYKSFCEKLSDVRDDLEKAKRKKNKSQKIKFTINELIKKEKIGTKKEHQAFNKVCKLGAAPCEIPDLMEQFTKNLAEKIQKQENPIQIAIFVHNQLIEIHPFINGNGRVARICMNAVLMQYGYQPICLKTQETINEYYLAVDQVETNPKLFESLVNKELKKYNSYIDTIENINLKENFEKIKQKIEEDKVLSEENTNKLLKQAKVNLMIADSSARGDLVRYLSTGIALYFLYRLYKRLPKPETKFIEFNLEIEKELTKIASYLSILSDMGKAYNNLKRYDKAEKHFNIINACISNIKRFYSEDANKINKEIEKNITIVKNNKAISQRKNSQPTLISSHIGLLFGQAQIDWGKRAETLYHQGKYVDAILYFKKALLSNCHDNTKISYYCMIGKCHYLLNKPDMAVSYYSYSLKLDARCESAYAWRAEAYRKQAGLLDCPDKQKELLALADEDDAQLSKLENSQSKQLKM